MVTKSTTQNNKQRNYNNMYNSAESTAIEIVALHFTGHACRKIITKHCWINVGMHCIAYAVVGPFRQ